MSPIFAQDVLLSPPEKALGKYCPPAAFSSTDWDSLSICGVTASNQGLQQTNPDRSSHLRFTLGQLWCHPKGGTEWGKPVLGNVCRVSPRPGWQQHERLSQETSVLLSHSAVGQSIWLQCCANSINSYLPFRSYYAEWGMTEKYNGRSLKWGTETASAECILCFSGCYNLRSLLQSPLSPISCQAVCLGAWCQRHSLCEKHNKDYLLGRKGRERKWWFGVKTQQL